MVTQVLGQVFMKRTFDDPFSALDEVLRKHPMGGAVQASLVDIHCEATSEKMAVGHFCNGRASAVIGTHTHVPTADGRILPKGTAYQSDLGMTGPRESVLGREIEACLGRFLDGMPRRCPVAERDVGLQGCIIDFDPGKTKFPTSYQRFEIRESDFKKA